MEISKVSICFDIQCSFLSALPETTVTVNPNPVYPGETVTLTCSAGSYSDWSYKWYKDNSEISLSQYKYLNTRSTISRVTESDQGLYWCQGERRSRPTSSSISDAVTVTVNNYQPKTTLTSDKENIFTGDSVTLSCTVESSGWKFYWYRHRPDSTPVATTSEYSCTLSWVNVSDGGQYWCRAGRGDPVYYTLYSDPVQINITAGDVILESPVHPVAEGDSVTLTCCHFCWNNRTKAQLPPGSIVSISLPRLLCGLLVMSPFLLVSIVLTVKCCRARGLCSTVKSPQDQIPCDDVIEQDESSV
ncbi:leukocyte immunoglobulin-like receptor subfamily A member 4 isoform X1 [Salmo trutta]|uniref:leukocyte immunoglobulin-like receptor subfamily A member 4 isoform X1 n=1 Tax=Salmo trutta TaxID=8032 RepID=UPI00113068A7|nr:leukocyte immunoglobulin-like receptor subfamily A member 4 isoform X1 [Salmo trutta]